MTTTPSFKRIRRSAAAFAVLASALWSARAEEAPAALPPDTAIVDEAGYVYPGTARDPFNPLIGAPAAGASAAAQSDVDPGAFNPASMELKGILRTKTGRWAMLTGAVGERYVVENGKIRDAKKKPVEGYVGIIKEKTLVLIGPNNQVTELKLKRDQESDSKP